MMKRNYSVTIALLIVLVAFPIGCYVLRMHAMFQPHTYDWSTGMPSLKDQVTAFELTNRRWPADYGDLVAFMKPRIRNFVPYSYKHIEFTTKPDGNLEITVYSTEYGTNSIIFKPSFKN
jgi:hypothetical protein